MVRTGLQQGARAVEGIPEIDSPPVERGALLLTIPEAAEALRLGVSSVKQMIREGELPVVRYGRAVRVPRSGLEQWVTNRTERETPPLVGWFPRIA